MKLAVQRQRAREIARNAFDAFPDFDAIRSAAVVCDLARMPMVARKLRAVVAAEEAACAAYNAANEAIGEKPKAKAARLRFTKGEARC